MNPPHELPESFNKPRYEVAHLWDTDRPHHMIDHTAAAYFSTPFSAEEIDHVKDHIRQHNAKSAPGADGVAYYRVLSTPSDALTTFFNECILHGNAPQQWLVAIIAAIPKKAKDISSPNNDRTIGLESCFAKTLTLLIERRVRQWAVDNNKIPSSQNGFRPRHRTNNNAFVLRAAIDKAQSDGKTLYVAFIDLTNAFPSVDQPTLWNKLEAMGVSGPVIDWLRMFYRSLVYQVRHAGNLSQEFQATAGILTGDPGSPLLWLLYLADCTFPDCEDDTTLGGAQVSHGEQADDIAIWSTSVHALQVKLDYLSHWCSINFLLVTINECI